MSGGAATLPPPHNSRSLLCFSPSPILLALSIRSRPRQRSSRIAGVPAGSRRPSFPTVCCRLRLVGCRMQALGRDRAAKAVAEASAAGTKGRVRRCRTTLALSRTSPPCYAGAMARPADGFRGVMPSQGAGTTGARSLG